MRHRSVITLFLLFAGLFPATVRSQTTTPVCLVYEMQARISIYGATFDRQGIFVVFPQPIVDVTGTNSSPNPFEFWFQIGKPSTFPEVGSIFFATNSAFIPGDPKARTALLSLADITDWTEPGVFQVTPRLYESNLLYNFFNVRTGLISDVYTVSGGGMWMAFSEEGLQIQGYTSFLGASFFYRSPNPTVPYEAEFIASSPQPSTSCMSAGR